MLDALEQSIQNPPGFVDPLIEQDGLFMDDVAKRLDQVEANIENASPVPLLPGDQAGGAPIIEDEERPATQLSPAEDGARLPEVEEADESQNVSPHSPKLRSRIGPAQTENLRLLSEAEMVVTVDAANRFPEQRLPEVASQKRGAAAVHALARIPMNRSIKSTASAARNTAIGPTVRTKNPKSVGTTGWPHPSSTSATTESTKKRNDDTSKQGPSARISLPDNSCLVARLNCYQVTKGDRTNGIRHILGTEDTEAAGTYRREVNNVSKGRSTEQRHSATDWPPRPSVFTELLTPVEAAQYLRLDETGNHTPKSAVRTLTYWRQKGQLKATRFARRVWYRRSELDRFLAVKTEE
jgi:hypothetical protein